MDIQAFHLPGEVPALQTVLERDGVRILAPPLQPEDVHRICGDLIQARSRLRALPAAQINAAVDAAARRLLQPDSPERGTALTALTAVTGYSPAMAALVLDRMAADWTTPALEALLVAEFGRVDAMDSFRPRPGGSPAGFPGRPADSSAGPGNPSAEAAAATGGTDPSRAVMHQLRSRPVAPSLGFHVFAGNVPGVGVTSLVRSLLVRSAVFGKSAAAEPVLAPIFARILAEVDEAVGRCVAVTWWPGGDEALEAAVLRHAGIVVHYGGADAIASLQQRAPAGVPFVDHGPRVSFALAGPAALDGEAMRGVAADLAGAVATFDQQGCVSPQMLYVVGSQEQARTMADAAATALRSIADELPRGRLDAAEAAAIRDLRSRAEFRGIAGRDVHLWTGDGLGWTVVLDDDPTFSGSCLNRTLIVKAVTSLDRLADLTRPVRHLLQTVGVAGFTDMDSVADLLAEMGATRVAPISAMPWPPPTWHHDGRGPLTELVRWVDLEGLRPLRNP